MNSVSYHSKNSSILSDQGLLQPSDRYKISQIFFFLAPNSTQVIIVRLYKNTIQFLTQELANNVFDEDDDEVEELKCYEKAKSLDDLRFLKQINAEYNKNLKLKLPQQRYYLSSHLYVAIQARTIISLILKKQKQEFTFIADSFQIAKTFESSVQDRLRYGHKEMMKSSLHLQISQFHLINFLKSANKAKKNRLNPHETKTRKTSIWLNQPVDTIMIGRRRNQIDEESLKIKISDIVSMTIADCRFNSRNSINHQYFKLIVRTSNDSILDVFFADKSSLIEWYTTLQHLILQCKTNNYVNYCVKSQADLLMKIAKLKFKRKLAKNARQLENQQQQQQQDDFEIPCQTQTMTQATQQSICSSIKLGQQQKKLVTQELKKKKLSCSGSQRTLVNRNFYDFLHPDQSKRSDTLSNNEAILQSVQNENIEKFRNRDTMSRFNDDVMSQKQNRKNSLSSVITNKLFINGNQTLMMTNKITQEQDQSPDIQANQSHLHHIYFDSNEVQEDNELLNMKKKNKNNVSLKSYSSVPSFRSNNACNNTKKQQNHSKKKSSQKKTLHRLKQFISPYSSKLSNLINSIKSPFNQESQKKKDILDSMNQSYFSPHRRNGKQNHQLLHRCQSSSNHQHKDIIKNKQFSPPLSNNELQLSQKQNVKHKQLAALSTIHKAKGSFISAQSTIQRQNQRIKYDQQVKGANKQEESLLRIALFFSPKNKQQQQQQLLQQSSQEIVSPDNTTFRSLKSIDAQGNSQFYSKNINSSDLSPSQGEEDRLINITNININSSIQLLKDKRNMLQFNKSTTSTVRRDIQGNFVDSRVGTIKNKENREPQSCRTSEAKNVFKLSHNNTSLKKKPPSLMILQASSQDCRNNLPVSPCAPRRLNLPHDKISPTGIKSPFNSGNSTKQSLVGSGSGFLKFVNKFKQDTNVSTTEGITPKQDFSKRNGESNSSSIKEFFLKETNNSSYSSSSIATKCQNLLKNSQNSISSSMIQNHLIKSQQSSAVSQKQNSLVVMDNSQKGVVSRNFSPSQPRKIVDNPQSIMSLKNGISNNNDFKIALLTSQHTAQFNRETSAFGDPNCGQQYPYTSIVTSSSCNQEQKGQNVKFLQNEIKQLNLAHRNHNISVNNQGTQSDIRSQLMDQMDDEDFCPQFKNPIQAIETFRAQDVNMTDSSHHRTSSSMTTFKNNFRTRMSKKNQEDFLSKRSSKKIALNDTYVADPELDCILSGIVDSNIENEAANQSQCDYDQQQEQFDDSQNDELQFGSKQAIACLSNNSSMIFSTRNNPIFNGGEEGVGGDDHHQLHHHQQYNTKPLSVDDMVIGINPRLSEVLRNQYQLPNNAEQQFDMQTASFFPNDNSMYNNKFSSNYKTLEQQQQDVIDEEELKKKRKQQLGRDNLSSHHHHHHERKQSNRLSIFSYQQKNQDILNELSKMKRDVTREESLLKDDKFQISQITAASLRHNDQSFNTRRPVTSKNSNYLSKEQFYHEQFLNEKEKHLQLQARYNEMEKRLFLQGRKIEDLESEYSKNEKKLVNQNQRLSSQNQRLLIQNDKLQKQAKNSKREAQKAQAYYDILSVRFRQVEKYLIPKRVCLRKQQSARPSLLLTKF